MDLLPQVHQTFLRSSVHQGWLHDATRLVIGARSYTLDKAMLKLDDASGYGDQADLREFWQKDRYVHIKE